jgi:RNA polymerase sigma-70 factor (ECF subfamily)
MEYSDKELLEKFADEGTRNYAFNLLVKKYQEKLYWHVRRMVVDHDDADDLVQDIFVKVWKSLEGFREDAKLYTWMYRIATNECITFLNKKKKRFFVPIVDVEAQLSKKIDHDPLFDGDKIQLQLQKAILTLPEKQRVVFHLKYYDEMKYEDMSEVLGTSVGALKASYHHAVKKIEDYMKGL